MSSEKSQDVRTVSVGQPREIPEFTIDGNEVFFGHETVDTLKSLFATKSLPFADAMISHCLNISGDGQGLENDKHQSLAIVAELAPNDAVEAMLATQMAAVHIALIRQSQHLAKADTIPKFEIYEKAFNRLSRTFVAQTEAIRKHRNGGQQKVTVEHVTVNEGGQAIVGDVTHRGAGNE